MGGGLLLHTACKRSRNGNGKEPPSSSTITTSFFSPSPFVQEKSALVALKSAHDLIPSSFSPSSHLALSPALPRDPHPFRWWWERRMVERERERERERDGGTLQDACAAVLSSENGWCQLLAHTFTYSVHS